MKKFLVLLAFASLGFYGCSGGGSGSDADSAGSDLMEAVEDAADDMGDAMEDAADEAEDAMEDAADAAEDMQIFDTILKKLESI